jgi:hypothetical protein
MTVWHWETEEESGKLLGKVATHQVTRKILQSINRGSSGD